MTLHKTATIAIFCATLALVLAVAPHVAAACTPRHAPQAHAAVDDSLPVAVLAKVLLAETNAARCSAGRAALVLSPDLVAAATDHARAMAARKTLSHSLSRPGRKTLQDRLAQTGARYGQAAENIAQTHVFAFEGRAFSTQGPCRFFRQDRKQVPRHSIASLARSLVRQWLASPPHRAALLRRSYARMGAGVGIAPDASTCGLVYAAQVFTD